MKKFVAFLLALMMVFAMFGCAAKEEAPAAPAEEEKVEAPAEEKKEEPAEEAESMLVGVSLPTKSLQRWNQDGEYMQKALEEMGYEVDLQFAEDKTELQVSQIDNMITKGAKVIIICPIDVSTLTNVLETAKSQDVAVISYDRLITDTAAVDYYATFDNNIIGKIIGKYIVDELGLENGNGPFNMEIVSGPNSDATRVLFEAAVGEVQPYIDNGQLVIRSGQTDMEQTATPFWQEKEAQARMDNILTAFYAEEHLDAVLCLNDSTSLGSQSALKAAGYGTESNPMPIMTGQDCDIANVKAIIAGDQSMSVFKDTKILAAAVAEMADQILKGETVMVNDTESYDNFAKIVPSYLIESQFVDQSNWQELLVDGGYYTAEELQ